MKKEQYSPSFTSLQKQFKTTHASAYQHFEHGYLAWWLDRHDDSVNPDSSDDQPLRNFNKVFCIGFNKTGTKSLHQLFLQLGLNSYHGEGWRDSTSCMSLLANYDTFLDDTIPLDFITLDTKFSNSRFILQTRPLEDWLISRLRHIDRNRAKSNYTGGWLSNDIETVANWIQQRQDYHSAVLDHFSVRPRDLLVVDFCNDLHAHRAVTSFIGLPHPSSSFERPHRGAWHQHRLAMHCQDEDRYRTKIAYISAQLRFTHADLCSSLLCPSQSNS